MLMYLQFHSVKSHNHVQICEGIYSHSGSGRSISNLGDTTKGQYRKISVLSTFVEVNYGLFSNHHIVIQNVTSGFDIEAFGVIFSSSACT